MNENDTGRQLASSAQLPEAMMPAEFGLAMATFVVIASMVGVGVLTTSGYTMALVGSNQYMLALWVVGGVIALCGALTLAELSAALPAISTSCCTSKSIPSSKGKGPTYTARSRYRSRKRLWVAKFACLHSKASTL